MSYILDALRRAEAERERGAVPSLQSQQHTVIEEDDAAPRSRRLVWAVVGLGGALIALLAWTLFGGNATPPRPPIDGSVPQATVTPPKVALPVTNDAATPAPAPAPAPTPAPMPALIAPPSPAVAAAPPAATRVVPAATAAPAATAPLAAAPTAEARPAARRAGAASSPPLAAAPAASTAPTRIYAQSELPEDVRRELPRIAVNGSSYSSDPASRMVMINGQIFHEGDSLGGGLALDRINRRSAVLTYRGWHYEVAF
jgi:general secretion pathway protein B